MEIKIIYDKSAIDAKFRAGWGFSAFIDGRILFDTGEKGEWLLDNLDMMNIDIADIEKIVISHDHWDHTGGLQAVLNKKNENPSVYICPGFTNDTKEQIIDCGGKPIEVAEFKEIEKNIYTTGAIPAYYKGKYLPEQALAIKTEKGISVITGCAHPGILLILETVKNHFKANHLFLAMGGFHLYNEDEKVIKHILQQFKNMGVEMAGPTHCSGPKAEELFAEDYGERFINIKAGTAIEI